MEDAKYSADIKGNVSGFVQGDNAQVNMHFHAPTHIPEASFRSILGGPPLTDPRSIQQRSTLVESIITQLKQPGLNALVLTGIGGVGKSTVAGLIYHYVQHHLSEVLFTAAPLWLSIDATTTFADVLGSIYQVLEKPLPDLRQLSPASQAQALFFTLSMTPARLIVIDQCEVVLESKTGKAISDRPGLGEWFDTINSQPFETGCRLLLTSRQRPRGNHADPPTYLQVTPIGGLSTQEGVELFLLRKVQAAESEIKQAVTLCSGHGLSLALLLNLVQDYGMPLADLLSDISLWEGDIATNLLDKIFEQLSPFERAVLCAFSVYRLPVPIEAAQAILEPGYHKQARPALRMSLNQHLLQSVGSATYQLHLIVARYAQQQLGEADEQANQQTLQQAHTKAALYYQELSTRLSPPPEQRRRVKEMEPLLEAIWHLTEAGMWQEAIELAADEEVFQTLKRSGGYAHLLETTQLLLASSSWQGQPAEKVFLFSWQGEASRVLGRPQQALLCFEQALVLAQEVGNKADEGATLGNLGGLYDALGKQTEALAYYEQALRILREVGDRAGEGRTLHNLGGLYDALGKQTEALAYYEQALVLAQEIGDRADEGGTLNNLGKLYQGLGKQTEALAYYEQALVLAQEVGDRAGEGATLNNLGLLYANLGKQTEALAYYEQALAIYQEIGYRAGEGGTLGNLGLLYHSLGKQTEVLAYYEQTLAIRQGVGDRAGEGRTLTSLGGLYEDLGKKTEALESYQQALAIAQEVGDRASEGIVLNNLGWIYDKLGERTEALEYYQQALVIFQEVSDRSGEGVTLYNMGTLFLEQKQYATALAALLLAQRLFQQVLSPDLEDVEARVTELARRVGQEQFRELYSQVSLQPEHILEQALSEWKEQNKD